MYATFTTIFLLRCNRIFTFEKGQHSGSYRRGGPWIWRQIYFIQVNVSKTKVQVFHRGPLPACAFNLDGRTLEIVNDFIYLGFNFSTQLSFSLHVQNINSKARAKCGLLFTKLPMMNLPLNLVIDLFSTFILPIYLYGLPLWLSNCSASSLQMVNATYTKFLKRYLCVPPHSNNASIHFLTSTSSLSKSLKRAAPNAIRSLSFPEILHGHRLSFFPQTTGLEQDQQQDHLENIEQIPSTFWLSRNISSIPLHPKFRKRMLREILDTDHFKICKTSTFHTHSLSTCLCINCGEHAHQYHERFCLL